MDSRRGVVVSASVAGGRPGAELEQGEGLGHWGVLTLSMSVPWLFALGRCVA